MKIYLNGNIVDEHHAHISVFDRGFLFGDGVYELVRYFNGIGVGEHAHAQRLARSLDLAKIRGFDAAQLGVIARATMAANGLTDAIVYMQVTRGAGTMRAHVPNEPLKPTVVAIATAGEPLATLTAPSQIAAVTAEDLRWKLCEIKTISLMGNILHLLDADARGANEAILHRDGFVGEGAYSNVALVSHGTLVTTPIAEEPPILHGTARADLLTAARTLGVPVEVRRVRVEELPHADELMITSSRRFISAVVRLNGQTVGTGSTGPITHKLFDAMRHAITRDTHVATMLQRS